MDITELVGAHDVRIEDVEVTLLNDHADVRCFHNCIAACRGVAVWAVERDRSSFAGAPICNRGTDSVHKKFDQTSSRLWKRSCCCLSKVQKIVEWEGYEGLVFPDWAPFFPSPLSAVKCLSDSAPRRPVCMRPPRSSQGELRVSADSNGGRILLQVRPSAQGLRN